MLNAFDHQHCQFRRSEQLPAKRAEMCLVNSLITTTSTNIHRQFAIYILLKSCNSSLASCLNGLQCAQRQRQLALNVRKLWTSKQRQDALKKRISK